MKCLSVLTISLLCLCACVLSVTGSILESTATENLKENKNHESTHTAEPPLHNIKDKDMQSLNSKGNIILSVTRDTEEFTDIFSNETLEEMEQETTEGNQTDQDVDDIPVIISFEPVQEEIAESVESSEKQNTHMSENPIQTLETLNSTEILKKLDKMMTHINTQDKTIKELKSNNKKLKAKIDQIDNRVRTNNVIFMNIRENKNESYKSLTFKVIQIINRIMRLRVNADEIVVAKRINSGKTEDQVRPVVVTFSNFALKLRVLTAKNKLKRSKFDILDDYNDSTTQIRRMLLPFLHEQRRLGHKVSMVHNRLIVDGVKKSLSELREESKRENNM